MHFIGALLSLYLVRGAGATETITDLVKAVSEWFADKDSAETKYGGAIGDWDVSSVRNMESLFLDSLGPSSDFNDDISKWDTSRVTDMGTMFYTAERFNKYIGDWDTARVTSMMWMFAGTSFNEYIGDWDTASVTDMTNMFIGTDAFNQYVGHWDTARVTDLTGTFYDASAFNQYVSDWDTARVTALTGTFGNSGRHGASVFNQYVKWDTARVTSMNSIFDGAQAFDQHLGWCLSGLSEDAREQAFTGTKCESDNCGVSFAETCPTFESEEECCSCTGNSDGATEQLGSQSVVIVVCVAAAAVLVAGLYVWNKRAVARKQPHRESSMPAVVEDPEASAD